MIKNIQVAEKDKSANFVTAVTENIKSHYIIKLRYSKH